MLLNHSAKVGFAFQVGDRVEQVGGLVHPYMRYGTIVRALPSQDFECLNEYEIDFGRFTSKLYESQIRIVKPAAEAGAA